MMIVDFWQTLGIGYFMGLLTIPVIGGICIAIGNK